MIDVKGIYAATPAMNVSIISLGAILSSVMGTTGASIVLITPLLQINGSRRNKAHTVLCFIFAVSNIGGCLSPLGDPPLFVGFLNGVNFFWPFKNLFLPMSIVLVPLLTGYWALDKKLYKKERIQKPKADRELSSADKSVAVSGIAYMALFPVVALITIGSEIITIKQLKISSTISLSVISMLRNFLLLVIAALVFRFGSRKNRKFNRFSSEPLKEVGMIFLGVFITAMPVVEYISSCKAVGVFSILNDSGPLRPALYFWITGILSSILDNAPTYLLMFHAAGGKAALIDIESNKILLKAISCGSVFMGALTYIGNSPNLLVKAVSEQRGVKMPSFIAYSKWAIVCLTPLFVLLTAILFVCCK
ncbi:sodium:proton antiporter [Candidatus Hydrogenosomobacter endosymbioticus]|uniref:Sodium:proton antiporter n=1 Tax=Candidatus Hydrogenosomobacter endosymbioticus TaxID=2558174 RepID=A0ABM7V8E8_9PROT|nr:sodium:proton antiporter [Candidatus Hydrogenosomobacter endosymbioticus]